jgi:hypothetical protein
MHLVAFERHAHDQRYERGKHEAIERRPVHRGEVEAAQHDAEDAHDEQRLVRRGSGKHHDGREAPESPAIADPIHQ